MTNILDLTGKSYIVTGAASGIGRATALLISAYGAKVLLIDIDEEKLSIVASECKGESETLVIDLTDSEAINYKLKEKLSTFGKLNGFIHCAGLPYVAPLNAIKSDKADIVHKLNTYAVIELAKLCSKKSFYAGEKGAFVLILCKAPSSSSNGASTLIHFSLVFSSLSLISYSIPISSNNF